MPKASRSGITVSPSDVPIILAMIARGDRKHDIAAWFGLNQGRIAEIEGGDHGTPPLAPQSEVPPSGSPGPKALELRRAVEMVGQALQTGDIEGALNRLAEATAEFDRNE